jgi:excisionase family DNA binding protein
MASLVNLELLLPIRAGAGTGETPWALAVPLRFLPLVGEAERAMLVDFVEPGKWYSVDEVAEVLGFSRDTIIRLTKKGLLEALTLPAAARSRRRVYSSRRVQGAEIVRFVKTYTGMAR